ncbi:SDR family oxidoreductase [Blastococcus sp. HT6-30]|uniref:SDR family NAD(P)-dependent oxidoreductase n=1 Tax=Blastococcus sp. HT6-30 TaxID=3144843 RepID=UPI003219F83C
MVLVTGGTSGIGLATAAAFLDAGAAVAVAGRDAGPGQTALRRLEPHAREACMVMFQLTDVTEEGEVEELVRAVQRRFGGLDIAVNGAANAEGAADSGPAFTDMSSSAFEYLVRASLTSVWLCMPHELPAIAASGGGSIINISSIDALLAPAGTAPYAAAKAGVNALSRAAAAEYASRGIRVNVISPGAVRTPMLEANLAADSEEARAALLDGYLSRIAARRLGEPREVAAAAVWLASEHASYVIGHNLVIDGAVDGAW